MVDHRLGSALDGARSRYWGWPLSPTVATSRNTGWSLGRFWKSASYIGLTIIILWLPSTSHSTHYYSYFLQVASRHTKFKTYITSLRSKSLYAFTTWYHTRVIALWHCTQPSYLCGFANVYMIPVPLAYPSSKLVLSSLPSFFLTILGLYLVLQLGLNS